MSRYLTFLGKALDLRGGYAFLWESYDDVPLHACGGTLEGMSKERFMPCMQVRCFLSPVGLSRESQDVMQCSARRGNATLTSAYAVGQKYCVVGFGWCNMR